MNSANGKWLPVFYPALPTAGAVTTVEIDTLGYAYMELLVMLGVVDGALTTFKLSESDTTGQTTAGTDITGLIVGTSYNSEGGVSALPSAASDGTAHLFNVDLKGRKRFLYLQIVVGAGGSGDFIAAVAKLTKAQTTPKNAAGFNVTQALQSPAIASS